MNIIFFNYIGLILHITCAMINDFSNLYLLAVMCNATTYLYGHLSLVLQPGFRNWKPSIHLYATTISEDFTEWHIMLAIALGSLFHAGSSGWYCIIVYSYVVAISYTVMRVIGVTASNHFRVHVTIGFPMLVKLYRGFSLVYNVLVSCKQWLMKTLNFLRGLWLCSAMSQCMLVLFQALNPALKLSRYCGRGTHVVRSLVGSDPQLWGLTISSRAHKKWHTLSWFLFGIPSCLSWLLGVLGAWFWTILLLVQRQNWSEDSLTGKDMHYFIALISWHIMCYLFLETTLSFAL